MLRRSRSLPPSYGLRRRDASPVDHRRKQRSQSFSGDGARREMSKELRMLDTYEKHHKRRLARQRTLGVKLGSSLDLKNRVLDDLEDRFQRLEERKMLAWLAEKAARSSEEAKIVMEKLNSALVKLDKIMSKAENLKKLDLEAKSGDDKQDTCTDAKRRKQEEAQKERIEMYQMIEELTKEEIHGATTQEDAETQK